MSCIVYQTNKKTGVVYAYESESYRDPITKKPKSKRTYLGRVDPDTNLIIPKAEEGKRNRSGLSEISALLPNDAIEEIAKQKAVIKELQVRINELTQKYERNNNLVAKIKELLDSYE